MRPYLQIGTRLVSTYELAHVLGVLAGILLGYRGLRRVGLSRHRAAGTLVFLAIAAHVCAHFYDFFTHPLSYRENSRAFWNLWMEGLSLHGGLVGAFLGILLVSWLWKTSAWRLGDALAPAGALALAFFRIGCHARGCCFGRPCGESFFLAGVSVKLVRNVETSLHPTQLYSAAAALVLFLVLSTIERRKLFDGQTVIAGLLLYAPGRFLIEFLRADTPKRIVFLSMHLTSNQVFAALFFALGLLLLALRRTALREALLGCRPENPAATRRPSAGTAKQPSSRCSNGHGP